jgi:hypothetical protein
MPGFTVQQFPFVSVAGAPYERGVQYGAAVAGRVRRSAELYGGTLQALGIDAVAKARMIGAVARTVENFAAHCLEEMRGIAAGAGITLEDVMLINARTEVVALARLETGRPEAGEEADGCTGAVILPERSHTGKLIHGQNWDWRAACAETAVVLRVRRDDGPDFLTFVEAGGLARCGVNAAGIAITANYLESERDYRTAGVPLVLIRRRILEQRHFPAALRILMATPKSCSNNMMLSTREGFAIDVECAPDEAFPLYPEDGILVHANHWLSPVALAKLRDTAMMGDSFYRDRRVRQLLGTGMVRADDLKAALFDDFAAPFSVCRPVLPNSAGDPWATVAMVIIDSTAGTMDVAPLPAHNRRFTRYSLSAEPCDISAAAR